MTTKAQCGHPILPNAFIVLCILLAFSGVVVTTSSLVEPPQYGNGQVFSAVKVGDAWTVKDGVSHDAVAVGTYNDVMNLTGWRTLTIRTMKHASDEQQAYAAGFLEGVLTNQAIRVFWNDWQVYGINGSLTSEVRGFLEQNIEYVEKQIQNNNNNNNNNDKDHDYWFNVGLIWEQLHGLTDGVNYAISFDDSKSDTQQMDFFDMFLFNLDGDFGDVVAKFQDSKWMPDPTRGQVMPEDRAKQYVLTHTHCSVLIKLSPGQKEVFLGHTTWDTFSSMNRIFKHYEFEFNSASVVSKTVSFSSSPGWLSSVDDYYLTSVGLAVTETTNEILNPNLYDKVHPHSVLSWVRVMVANRMASHPQQWTQIFAKENSGTYNNQWMVFDMRRFDNEGIHSSSKNLFWIAEQIPGKVESGDMTQTLSSQNYWPSYNIPYFPSIFNISGYPAYEEKYGDYWSYNHCPRANIFRRDHNQVKDIKDMMHTMRYNDWQNDPFSLKDACNSISARCDLNPPNSPSGAKRQPFGGIDSKVTSNSLIRRLTTLAVSGPTHQSQPVFVWTQEFVNFVAGTNQGQPAAFPFEWQVMQPSALVSETS